MRALGRQPPAGDDLGRHRGARGRPGGVGARHRRPASASRSGSRRCLGAFGIDLPSTTLQLQPRTVVVAFIVGVGVTVVASDRARPPRREGCADRGAARASQEAARPAWGSVSSSGSSSPRPASAALCLRPVRRALERGLLIGAGAAVTFIGVAILSPLAAKPLAGAIGSPRQATAACRASSGARTRCATRAGPPRRRRP